MQNSKLIASVAVVLVAAGGIGGYAIYQKTASEGVRNQFPSDNVVASDTPSNSANQETTNPSQVVPNTRPSTITDNERDGDDNEGDDDSSDDNSAVPIKQQNPVTPPATPPATTPTDTTKRTAKYKDGTYSATGSYNSPGGLDQLGVSVTIKNDIVTAATVTNMAGDSRSKNYQDRFISGYQAFVIGKNIDSIKLDVVSGASLTPIGFNVALSQIKTKAKA